MNSSAKSGVLVSVAGVTIHALLWPALAFGMVFLMPTIKKEFVEYKMKLPAIAEYTVVASDWFSNYWSVLDVADALGARPERVLVPCDGSCAATAHGAGGVERLGGARQTCGRLSEVDS